jgi:NADH:ubiquinone reductase (H+-translocating)
LDAKPATAPSMAGNGRPAHVVIVGGGFGGLYAARALARHDLLITLIDRENYHLFQPLLYQVATAALSPGDIAEPLRAILRKHRNVRVWLEEVTSVDLANRRVIMANGDVGYDYLIVATGSRHSYFGHDEWEPLAPGLKTLGDALEIRRRILWAFEAAERESDPEVRQALLTLVIVGGGPTGVELAGAIAEIRRHTVARDFRAIDPTSARVILLEGGPRVLATYPEDLSSRAERSLRRLGVEVRTGAMVTRVTPDAVHIGGEIIPTRTTLWAAGVAASALGGSLDTALDHSGRVMVQPDLTLPAHPEVYVIGDLAAITDSDGKPLPGVATVAIQQGKAAADNIWRAVHGKPRRPFRYVDKGSLATIGRGQAVADIVGSRVHLSGLPAWLVWVLVHLMELIGFSNRVLVLLQWVWAYFTHERGARLITQPWPLYARWKEEVGRDSRQAPRARSR